MRATLASMDESAPEAISVIQMGLPNCWYRLVVSLMIEFRSVAYVW